MHCTIVASIARLHSSDLWIGILSREVKPIKPPHAFSIDCPLSQCPLHQFQSDTNSILSIVKFSVKIKARIQCKTHSHLARDSGDDYET